jgi:hypothetical protein
MSLQDIYMPYCTLFTQARSLMGLWSCFKCITIGSLRLVANPVSVDRHNTHGMTLCCTCEYLHYDLLGCDAV